MKSYLPKPSYKRKQEKHESYGPYGISSYIMEIFYIRCLYRRKYALTICREQSERIYLFLKNRLSGAYFLLMLFVFAQLCLSLARKQNNSEIPCYEPGHAPHLRRQFHILIFKALYIRICFIDMCVISLDIQEPVV